MTQQVQELIFGTLNSDNDEEEVGNGGWVNCDGEEESSGGLKGGSVCDTIAATNSNNNTTVTNSHSSRAAHPPSNESCTPPLFAKSAVAMNANGNASVRSEINTTA